ncbi:MAG: chemotaxis protein CheD [Planctomycetes bacterium]|nr:chemotaxis protein CheD [Planctomycetota bacterium]
MSESLSKTIVSPGHIFVSAEALQMQSVVTYGVIVTVYNPLAKTGGLAHYLYPRRRKDRPSTALYAAPAIVTVVDKVRAAAPEADLEVHLYGAALEVESDERAKLLVEDNTKVALEILEKQKASPHSTDFGGHRGRKVLFNAHSGDILVAKVANLRKEDWLISADGPVMRPKEWA